MIACQVVRFALKKIKGEFGQFMQRPGSLEKVPNAGKDGRRERRITSSNMDGNGCTVGKLEEPIRG